MAGVFGRGEYLKPKMASYCTASSGRFALMGHYKSNLRDLEFNLFEVFGADQALGRGPFEQMEVDTARDVLKEMERLCVEDLAESFVDSDRNPPVFDPDTHSVTLPESFKQSWRTLVDSEFWRLDALPELGGQAAPRGFVWAMGELVLGANPALYMYLAGVPSATILYRNGTLHPDDAEIPVSTAVHHPIPPAIFATSAISPSSMCWRPAVSRITAS